MSGVIVKTTKRLALSGFLDIPDIQMLKNRRYGMIDKIRTDGNHLWTNQGRSIYCSNILFIGQTGTGKSTTINRLTGGNYMLTSDIECCTKDMNSIDFELADDCYLCYCDMPGIGENSSADIQYYEWYSDMFYASDCVVYLLRADKRDFGIDLEEFGKLRELGEEKLIIALNCVDKIPPINRNGQFYLNTEQERNLEKKILDICHLFSVSRASIIPFSAVENYNIKNLKRKISETLLVNLGISI